MCSFSKVTLYRGPSDVFRHVVANEGGIVGLFRGINPTLWREVPGNAIMFGVYELLKQQMAYVQVSSIGGSGNSVRRCTP